MGRNRIEIKNMFTTISRKTADLRRIIQNAEFLRDIKLHTAGQYLVMFALIVMDGIFYGSNMNNNTGLGVVDINKLYKGVDNITGVDKKWKARVKVSIKSFVDLKKRYDKNKLHDKRKLIAHNDEVVEDVLDKINERDVLIIVDIAHELMNIGLNNHVGDGYIIIDEFCRENFKEEIIDSLKDVDMDRFRFTKCVCIKGPDKQQSLFSVNLLLTKEPG